MKNLDDTPLMTLTLKTSANMPSIGEGRCAKKIVTCTLVTLTGGTFIGRNDCWSPQAACPRAHGEGYEKCKSICDQPGHAEEMAIRAAKLAGADLKRSTAYLEGISHYCKECQVMLFEVGVESLRIKR